MSTNAQTTRHDPDCERFEAQLGPWLERDLDAVSHAWMTRHRASCSECAALVAELESIMTQASALPGITPPRDLWNGIESRLEAPVIPLPTRTTVAARRTISVRRFAIAAAALVAVTSGVTWQLATRANRGASTTVATGDTGTSTTALAQTTDSGMADNPAPLSQATSQLAVGTPTALPARQTRIVPVSIDEDPDGADATYEREITVLRRIVDERFAELDTTTVRELRRNLDIIDRAIADSRDLLSRDPRSGLLASQLDRALKAKLDLLRRVALL